MAITGRGVVACAAPMDRVFARELVRARGVRVARAVALSRAGGPSPGSAAELEPLAVQGCVIKPRRGGSSVGCSIVHGRAELGPALERAFQEGPEVLVEAFVRGIEATGGVLQAPGGEVVALPPVEIRPRG